jgi:hypothetical protein
VAVFSQLHELDQIRPETSDFTAAKWALERFRARQNFAFQSEGQGTATREEIPQVYSAQLTTNYTECFRTAKPCQTRSLRH